MTWNYRIVKRKHISEFKGETFVEYAYGIHEAYYDKNGKICSITVDAIDAFGKTLDELKSNFKKQKRAFTMPVLDYDQIPEPESKEQELFDVTKDIEYKVDSEKKSNKKLKKKNNKKA